MGSLSVATCLAISLSAAREEDLPDLGLEAGLGGGLWGVRKEEAAGALLNTGTPDLPVAGEASPWGDLGRSSSSPSNWGMVDMERSASREDALEDRGRDPGVTGGLWTPCWMVRVGVWRLADSPKR